MNQWIERYVHLVTATHKRYILLHDRDGLLTYDELRRAIEELGYVLLSAETAWQVRIHYELTSNVNPHRKILLVPARYSPLPDMAADIYLVEIGLRELFPLLDATVLQDLPIPALAVISAMRQYTRLGREATVKWLLEHIYNIDADSLKTSPDRDRILQALRKVYEHPAGSNSVIQDYLQTLAAPHKREFNRLMDQVSAYINHPATTADAWFDRVPILGKAMCWAMDWPDKTGLDRLNGVMLSINRQFQLFLDTSYESLFSLSAAKRPAVISRVLDYVQAQSSEKKALIVIDGMNVWQGQLFVEALVNSGLIPIVGATMAYIPSITAWSRQALFKGGRPDLTTDNHREGKLFELYWQTTGLQPNQIHYSAFSYGTPFPLMPLPDTIIRLGLVCNDLDNLMHGTILGNSQLEKATRHWITDGPVLPLIASLKQSGFTCYITADHGNLEATGLKSLKLAEKIGALSRSKRHIQFTNALLVSSFKEQNPQLDIGIRDRSIYLRDTSAFTTESKTVITHGGSHFWEVLVPFIQV